MLSHIHSPEIYYVKGKNQFYYDLDIEEQDSCYLDKEPSDASK
jgi:hypothetical protein